MKLYLLTRTDQVGYDEFVSFVVCAKSKTEALTIHPAYTLKYPKFNTGEGTCPSWAPKNIKIEYLGEAAPHLCVVCVICSSFNAG